MSKIDQIKAELCKIASVYPTFLGMMKKRPLRDGPTYGERWASMLQRFELDDIANYCDRVEAGDILPVPIDERGDTLPFYIAEHCRAVQAGLERALDQHEKYYRHDPAETIEELSAYGPRRGPLAERVASLVAAHGPTRFACYDCEDAGAVQVWSTATMRAVAAGEAVARLQVGVVACRCRRGVGLRTSHIGKWTWAALPEYDPEKMVRVMCPDLDSLRDLAAAMESMGVVVPPLKIGTRLAARFGL